MLGAVPPWARPAVKGLSAMVNQLPSFLQEQVYIWSGWFEAIAARQLDRVTETDLARWAVNQYPKRRYPAVAIGSSNGAATHLWAALGIPWLPQTFLVPVARFPEGTRVPYRIAAGARHLDGDRVVHRGRYL